MLKTYAGDYKFFKGINMSKNQANKIVGANIRKKRNEVGMTTREFAELTGLTIAIITSLENGLRVRGFSPYELHKVAVVLNVSIDSLYEGI